jgi:hypothetical protein
MPAARSSAVSGPGQIHCHQPRPPTTRPSARPDCRSWSCRATASSIYDEVVCLDGAASVQNNRGEFSAGVLRLGWRCVLGTSANAVARATDCSFSPPSCSGCHTPHPRRHPGRKRAMPSRLRPRPPRRTVPASASRSNRHHRTNGVAVHLAQGGAGHPARLIPGFPFLPAHMGSLTVSDHQRCCPEASVRAATDSTALLTSRPAGNKHRECRWLGTLVGTHSPGEGPRPPHSYAPVQSRRVSRAALAWAAARTNLSPTAGFRDPSPKIFTTVGAGAPSRCGGAWPSAVPSRDGAEPRSRGPRRWRRTPAWA